MGSLFEELVRHYNEEANEEADDHFTPREVIRLMVHLLFAGETEVFGDRQLVRTLYDPACGTSGMLLFLLHMWSKRKPVPAIPIPAV
jgi:type I restriction enzyme M protein